MLRRDQGPAPNRVSDAMWPGVAARRRLFQVATVREDLVVPFVDLGQTHGPLKGALLAEVSALLDTGAFTNGSAIGSFEKAFASWCRRRFSVGVSSGLDALRLSLLAVGIEPGDEVILPAHTFVATIEAATQAGGQPVLVDISESDYCVDVAGVRAAVTASTRFLVPVHLYGQLADMTASTPSRAATTWTSRGRMPGSRRHPRWAWAEGPDVRPR